MSGENVILVEGPDDRDFVGGWLVRAGWTAKPRDIYVRKLPAFQFTFGHPSGAFARIVTFETGAELGTGDRLRRAIGEQLRQHLNHPIARLVVVVDSDDAAGTRGNEVVAGVRRDFTTTHTNIEWHGIVWACDDAAADGVPEKQTLERLVCAAFLEADAARGVAVKRWLEDAPVAAVTHKNHAMSYWAKWTNADRRDFYKGVWQDSAVATALEKRLRASGAWDVVERLATP
jgi:hypothetical protein